MPRPVRAARFDRALFAVAAQLGRVCSTDATQGNSTWGAGFAKRVQTDFPQLRLTPTSLANDRLGAIIPSCAAAIAASLLEL